VPEPITAAASSTAKISPRTDADTTGWSPGRRPSVVYGWDAPRRAFLGAVIDRPAVGEPASVPFGDAAIGFVTRRRRPACSPRCATPIQVFARRRFFNTRRDQPPCAASRDGEAARAGRAHRRAQQGRRTPAALVTRVSDRALEETVGCRRRLSPIEVGVRAERGRARQRRPLHPHRRGS
jgi:hypothetical protein